LNGSKNFTALGSGKTRKFLPVFILLPRKASTDIASFPAKAQKKIKAPEDDLKKSVNRTNQLRVAKKARLSMPKNPRARSLIVLQRPLLQLPLPELLLSGLPPLHLRSTNGGQR
jgi:hypothetical protein